MRLAKVLLGCALVGILASGAVAQTFSTTGNVPIPDNGGAAGFVSLDLSVPSSGVIGDLDVETIIAHTFQGDLIVEVEQVGNQRIRLMDRPGVPELGAFGFGSDNLGNPATGALFIFDDEAAAPYDVPTPATANVTGNWQSDTASLSSFDGDNWSGDWRLWVSDNAGIDTGSIRHFGITVPEPATLALLGIGGLTMIRRRR